MTTLTEIKDRLAGKPYYTIASDRDLLIWCVSQIEARDHELTLLRARDAMFSLEVPELQDEIETLKSRIAELEAALDRAREWVETCAI